MNTMKKAKGAPAVFLVLLLVLALVPISAKAAEPVTGPARITGIVPPVTGQPLSDDYDPLPEGIGYVIDIIVWRDENGGTAYNAIGDGEYHAMVELSAVVDGGFKTYIESIGGDIQEISSRENFLKGFTVEGGVVTTTIGLGQSEFATDGNFINLRVDFPKTAPFVPVTGITGVPDTAAAAVPLPLAGTVAPSDATFQEIVWSIDPGATTAAGVSINSGNTLVANGEGKVTVIATVEQGTKMDPDGNGDEAGIDFVRRFEIAVTAPGAPAIAGPPGMTLAQGYAAAETETFTVTGSPAPAVAASGPSHIAWNGAGRKLEIAAGLPPGYYPVTLTASNGVAPDAVFTFTLTVFPKGPGTVTGEIGYDHNDPPFIPGGNVEPELDVVVSLWQNDGLVDAAEKMTLAFSDDVARYYTFAGVGDGWYTVVADSYLRTALFYTITRDVYVSGGLTVEPPEPIVFTPGKTQTILNIAEGAEARNVATNDLPDLFEQDGSGRYNPWYDAADRTLLVSGGEVEFQLNVANAAAAGQAALNSRIAADGYSSVLFVDLTLTKTRRGAGSEVSVPVPDVSPALLEIVVPMTSRQPITAVYRIHENEAPAALPGEAANAGGEYFRYDAEKNTVYLYVSRFSAYAFAAGTGGGRSGAPQTGDAGHAGLWVTLLAAPALGAAGLFARRQKQAGKGAR